MFDEVHNANHIVGMVRIEDKKFASDFLLSKSIDAVNVLVVEAIEDLSQKGVNMSEIKQQIKVTEEKIAE